MKNLITQILLSVTIIILASCAPLINMHPYSASFYGPRTIIIDNDTISEKECGGFDSWICKDFIKGGEILFEVGFFNNQSFEGIGFILFDGGYKGDITSYHRAGLDHRWDWGPNGNDYTFLIQPDGTGVYYDFSIKHDSVQSPRSIYKCYRR